MLHDTHSTNTSKLHSIFFRPITWFFLFFLFFVIFVLFLDRDVSQNENKSLRVVVTSFPLVDFFQNIGGNRIIVENLLAYNKNPHESELTINDRLKLHGADILVLDSHNEDILSDSMIEIIKENPQIKIIDISSDDLSYKRIDDFVNMHHHEFHDDSWFSSTFVKSMIQKVKVILKNADSTNESLYEKKYLLFKNKIDILFNDYQNRILSLRFHNTITTFDRSLCNLLNQNSFNHCIPLFIDHHDEHQEMSPLSFHHKVNGLNRKNVCIMLAPDEPLGNIEMMQAIQDAAKIRFLFFLHPISNITIEEQRRKVTYIGLMYDNLNILSNRLEATC